MNQTKTYTPFDEFNKNTTNKRLLFVPLKNRFQKFVFDSENRPHWVKPSINNGVPVLLVDDEPYKYSRVVPREGSSYHIEYMYFNQAIFELYKNVTKVSLFKDENNECNYLLFDLENGEKHRHAILTIETQTKPYDIVSIKEWK